MSGIKEGHPRFFTSIVNAEIEFIPDANGSFTSMVLHQNGHDSPARRISAGRN
jgi:hypothetical protein